MQPPAFLQRPAASAVYASHALLFQLATRFVHEITAAQVGVMQPAALEHVVVHVEPPAHYQHKVNQSN